MKPGAMLGPFQIEKPIGSGAMGQVYRAKYVKNGQKVAVKVMSPSMTANKQAMARFQREADVLKQLKHPNIVRFYAVGNHDGSPYYAMELIEGESVDDMLQKRGHLTWEEVVALSKQACAALQHAHSHGIIHRDLKPSNLIQTADGVLKLADFGIAKDIDEVTLTATNTTVGTAAYMSPEQCRGDRNITHKSDLYSFGVMLYELLTGQKPFKAETTMDMFLAHVNGKFERPSRINLDIPIWLDTLVCQLMEKEQEKRPYDANAVAEALDRISEKVSAGQSAGVEAARARKGGKSDEDKEAARTLTGRRGKRRKKGSPFYEKIWFQLAAIALLIAAIGSIVYAVFFLPPSADSLFRQAKKAMESTEKVDQKRGRDTIEQYLKHFGDLNDDQTVQMRKMAKDYDLAYYGQLVQNKFADEVEGVKEARAAMDEELRGNWEQAQSRWMDLAKHQVTGWRLLAEDHLSAMRDAGTKVAGLDQRIVEWQRDGVALPAANATESLALRALRYEKLGDFPRALESWRKIKEQPKDADDRLYALIAAAKSKEMENRLAVAKWTEDRRTTLVKQALADAEAQATSLPNKAWIQAVEIVQLYTDDPDPGVNQIVVQAKALIKKLEAKQG